MYRTIEAAVINNIFCLIIIKIRMFLKLIQRQFIDVQPMDLRRIDLKKDSVFFGKSAISNNCSAE